MVSKVGVLVVLLLGLSPVTRPQSAVAQETPNCVERSDFDACMQKLLEANLKFLIKRYEPELRREYAAHANEMTFEEFAYRMLTKPNYNDFMRGYRCNTDRQNGRPIC